MLEGPSVLKEKEYDNLMVFLEESYGHTRKFFQNFYPNVWKKETVDFENKFVIFYIYPLDYI